MIFVRPVAGILCLLFRVYGADDTQGISRVTWSFSSVLKYPCIKISLKKQYIFSGIMPMYNFIFRLYFELYVKHLYSTFYVSS